MGKILTFFRNLLLVVTKVVTVSSTLFVCARVLSATGSLGMPGGRSTASCCLFLSLSKNDGIVLFTAFFYFEEEKKEMIYSFDGEYEMHRLCWVCPTLVQTPHETSWMRLPGSAAPQALRGHPSPSLYSCGFFMSSSNNLQLVPWVSFEEMVTCSDGPMPTRPTYDSIT